MIDHDHDEDTMTQPTDTECQREILERPDVPALQRDLRAKINAAELWP